MPTKEKAAEISGFFRASKTLILKIRSCSEHLQHNEDQGLPYTQPCSKYGRGHDGLHQSGSNLQMTQTDRR